MEKGVKLAPLLARPTANERGAALLIVIMVMAMLMLIGMSASLTTDTGLLVAGSEKRFSLEFYHAEDGLNQALESADTWLTDIFLAAEVTTAATTFATVDPNDPADPDDDQTIATVSVRPIQDEDAAVAQANALPVQAHSAPPPPGSGYGMNRFVIRRYAVTAEPVGGNTRLQVGMWKVFNR